MCTTESSIHLVHELMHLHMINVQVLIFIFFIDWTVFVCILLCAVCAGDRKVTAIDKAFVFLSITHHTACHSSRCFFVSMHRWLAKPNQLNAYQIIRYDDKRLVKQQHKRRWQQKKRWQALRGTQINCHHRKISKWKTWSRLKTDIAHNNAWKFTSVSVELE